MSKPRSTVSAYGQDAQRNRNHSPANGQQRPSKKNKAAIELMVFHGLSRADAAEQVGLSDEGLRAALTRPWVLAYLNEQMEVLRTSARPKALRKVVELIDAEKLSPRVALDAARYIDGMDRTVHQQGATNVNVAVKVETPGYVIDLSEHPASGRQIEHLEPSNRKPLISQREVPDDE